MNGAPPGGSARAAAGYVLAERFLPFPDTVSPELAAGFADPGPIAERLAAAPGSREEWLRCIEEADAPTLEEVRALGISVPLEIVRDHIGGVPVHRIRRLGAAGEAGRLLLHLHGGGYVAGGGEAGLKEAMLMAIRSGLPVVSVDYRMPPDHPFPAALDDALAVWATLAGSHDPGRMAIFGTSAGGGLALSLAVRARDHCITLPAALGLATPWTDLAPRGDSYHVNRGVDLALPLHDGLLAAAAMLYAGGRDLADPALSPVYAELGGLPPTILLSGTRDLFLSCTVRAHRRLRAAGGAAELHVFEGVSHGELVSRDETPESCEAFAEMIAFFDRHLGADGARRDG